VKRALTAMVCGALLIFVVPQAASADTRSSHSAAPSAAPSDGSGHDTAAKPAPEDSGRPRQDAPGEGHSHYDRLHHDGDTF
jgi:hypothetical protein